MSDALASYTAAVEEGVAPAPLPLYAEQAAIAGGSSGKSFDVAFELLRLQAVASDPESSGSAAVLQPLLARLLRCGAGWLGVRHHAALRSAAGQLPLLASGGCASLCGRLTFDHVALNVARGLQCFQRLPLSFAA